MIKSILLTLLITGQSLIIALTTKAQVRSAERQENLQQQKIAFFTEKLQLSPGESSLFWPVYNDYQNRRDKITRDRNTLLQYYDANNSNLTESEANELIRKFIAYQQEELRLVEIYTKKFLEFLPAKKVMRIFIVELDFKKWLLENLRQNKSLAAPRK